MANTLSRLGGRAQQRLESEHIIWLTTVRDDGQPQPVPVWFLVEDGGTFLIYSRPHQQKLDNIQHSPKVALNLNSDASGGDILRVSGIAEITEGVPPANNVPEYLEKYREDIGHIGMDPESFAQAYSVAIRVTPTAVYGGS